MPTIEIVSFNSTGLGLNQAEFDIAIFEENKLKSHRGLFYNLLKKQKGVIVHIGNPDFKDNNEALFFAGKIIDWDFDHSEIFYLENNSNKQKYNSIDNQLFNFKFLEQYIHDIDKLLKMAIENSPIKKICFLTDYQFGPKNGKTKIIETITDFWILHNNQGLRLNTLYEMYGL